MGRETAIQKVCWTEDGWLRLEEGGCYPENEVKGIDRSVKKNELISRFDDFDSTELDHHFQTLRLPLGEDSMSLSQRPGYLMLKGRESLSSLHHQSMIARRQQSFKYMASTCLEFDPVSFQQMAGLICIYDTTNFYYLQISHDEEMGKSLNILVCDNNSFSYPLAKPICLQDIKRCYLKVEVSYDKLQFSYSVDKIIWNRVGPVFDASTLSDEYFEYANQKRFTGAFVGMCCQDMSGRKKPAYFDYFEYIETL